MAGWAYCGLQFGLFICHFSSYLESSDTAIIGKNYHGIVYINSLNAYLHKLQLTKEPKQEIHIQETPCGRFTGQKTHWQARRATG